MIPLCKVQKHAKMKLEWQNAEQGLLIRVGADWKRARRKSLG